MTALIQEAVNEIRPWGEDRRLRFAMTLPASLPKLRIDAKRIHQVVVNLLGNAVKFSQAGGLIAVTAAAADDHVVVAISDTGIGIPAPLQATIFERYEQAHDERGGTGLGLTIVKSFVTAHGGRVWVEFREGQGSCFSRYGALCHLEGPTPEAPLAATHAGGSLGRQPRLVDEADLALRGAPTGARVLKRDMKVVDKYTLEVQTVRPSTRASRSRGPLRQTVENGARGAILSPSRAVQARHGVQGTGGVPRFQALAPAGAP